LIENALWVTENVRCLRINCNNAERLYLKTKTKEHKINRNWASKESKKGVEKTTKDFESTLAMNTDVKPFWHYVN